MKVATWSMTVKKQWFLVAFGVRMISEKKLLVKSGQLRYSITLTQNMK